MVLVLRCCGGVVINEEQEEAGTNTRINLVQPIIWYRALIGAANHYFFYILLQEERFIFFPCHHDTENWALKITEARR